VICFSKNWWHSGGLVEAEVHILKIENHFSFTKLSNMSNHTQEPTNQLPPLNVCEADEFITNKSLSLENLKEICSKQPDVKRGRLRTVTLKKPNNDKFELKDIFAGDFVSSNLNLLVRHYKTIRSIVLLKDFNLVDWKLLIELCPQLECIVFVKSNVMIDIINISAIREKSINLDNVFEFAWATNTIKSSAIDNEKNWTEPLNKTPFVTLNHLECHCSDFEVVRKAESFMAVMDWFFVLPIDDVYKKTFVEGLCADFEMLVSLPDADQNRSDMDILLFKVSQCFGPNLLDSHHIWRVIFKEFPGLVHSIRKRMQGRKAYNLFAPIEIFCECYLDLVKQKNIMEIIVETEFAKHCLSPPTTTLFAPAHCAEWLLNQNYPHMERLCFGNLELEIALPLFRSYMQQMETMSTDEIYQFIQFVMSSCLHLSKFKEFYDLIFDGDKQLPKPLIDVVKQDPRCWNRAAIAEPNYYNRENYQFIQEVTKICQQH
jgi:hypothetical protein